MQPFDEHIYVPILLTKRGERSALADTPARVIAKMRPLFVVPAPDWDYDNARPKKTLDEHLTSLPADLVRTWGSDDAFLDATPLGDSDVFGGDHALFWLSDAAAAQGLVLTPVVRMDSSDSYVDAAATLAARGHGACIRLMTDYWVAGGPTNDLDERLNELSLDPEEVHLVLDLEDDVSADAAKAARDELQALPYRDDWASVTLALTAIPSGMPGGGSTVHTLPRHDWRIYEAMCGLSLPRVPSFGDYSINGAGEGLDLNPKLMSMSATLRYTTETDWQVSKGGLYKGTGGRSLGGAAVPPAAHALVVHADYLAPGHCGFEDWLDAAAAGGSPGNAETWRRWATHHHLQLVTEQVASLHGP